MVAGGKISYIPGTPTTSWSENDTTSVELLRMDPQSGKVIQKCYLPDMPEKRNEHTVDANIVCGGLNTPHNNCITLTEGEWKHHYLISERFAHSSWKVCTGVVLLGSYRGVGRFTAELVEAKTGKTKNLFDLDYGFE